MKYDFTLPKFPDANFSKKRSPRTGKSLISFYLFLSGICICFSGCKKGKEPIPGWKDDERKGVIELISGDNQSGIFGDQLSDSIVFKVYGRMDAPRRYLIKLRMRQGNGMANIIDAPYYPDFPDELISVDLDSYIKVKWELGCDATSQQMDILLYVDSVYRRDPKYYDTRPADDSVTISAEGRKPQGWGRACGCQLYDYLNARVISNNGILYLLDRIIYQSEDGGINWYPLPNLPPGHASLAQFDSKGRLYVVTESNGVFYSDNLTDWIPINDGLEDYRQPTAFSVFDDELYVSFYFDGPYQRTRHGAPWHKLNVSDMSQRFEFFNKHPNGNLYLVDDWNTLYVSADEGATWEPTQVGYEYIRSTVEDFKIGPDGMLYIASGDATISMISPTTYQGVAKSIYEWNGWSQHAQDIQFVNNDVLYLIMGSDQSGIYSKNANWSRVDLDFTMPIDGYYKKPDGGFLLQSGHRLYVKY